MSDEQQRLESVAIVTGAASGIGKAITKNFLDQGLKVVAADTRKSDDANFQHGNLYEVITDVSSESGCLDLFEQLGMLKNDLCILVNCAEVIKRSSILDTTPDEWNEIININLRSVYLMSRLAIPIMIKNGRGVIVNIASGWGLSGGRKAAAYCASKAGVVMLTKAMAIDHGSDNIRVNCVCPGDTDTAMLAEAARQLDLPVSALRDAGKLRPLGRIGNAQEIADAVTFLVSEKAKFISGTTLVVDGGSLAGTT